MPSSPGQGERLLVEGLGTKAIRRVRPGLDLAEEVERVGLDPALLAGTTQIEGLAGRLERIVDPP